jgi:hypothetical protein
MMEPPGARWAYIYQVVPPQSEDALGSVRALLDREDAAARSRGRIWVGRLIQEERSTRILIVCDTPIQCRKVNRRLEAELEQLHARFSVTIPMAVSDGTMSTDPGGGA